MRELIYHELLRPAANRLHLEDDYTAYDYRPALVLFRLNRQIYHEARKVFRDVNTFVRIETPWPEAQQHVWDQGQVPIIVDGERAANFTGHVMTVSIDAAEVPLDSGDEQRFLILLDDLEKFTKMWYYSTLSHPGLNPRLRLTLRLNDPFTPSYEEKRIPRALQRKLLLPFGMVKGLLSIGITGDPKPFPSIGTELKKLQSVPHAAPEQCLRDTLRLKQEGNEALKAERYESALQHYRDAWQAMHIVVTGSRRHIHADQFFNVELREAPFVGKNGQSERLVLRVQLVANTCLAYLKLGNYEQCAFWGMRSITMLREAMGADDQRDIAPEDEAVVGFPATAEMGKIYYRTALAKKMLDEKSEARKLLRVAEIYLPRDKLIKDEIAAVALRLG